MTMGKPRVSDAAVKKMTGKNWQQWFAVLDKAAGTRMSHRELAEHLHQKLGVPGWWSQMIAVTYEQERGLREVHQKADGYAVSASRTFQVPVGVLYRQWSDAKIRGMWLREKFTVRKETKNKSMRITWGDGRTSVEVYFYGKGDSKSQVSVQHSKLASSKDVELARSRSKGALERLAKIL